MATYCDEYKVNLPEGNCGIWKVEKFSVEENDLSQSLSMMKTSRYVPGGNYTKLTRNGFTIMSDTPDEIRDHMHIIKEARGNVLIAGLGLGVVLSGIARKDEVDSITVIEKFEDVINLVADHYIKKYPNKIKIICCDIFDWKPEKDVYYDFAWYDIWDNLCIDNLEDMKKLHRKFGRKTGWQGSWGRSFLESQLKREKTHYW